MFDRYDLRDNGRDDTREGERDLGIGGRGGGGDPQDVRDGADESVFTRDLDLPRSRDRELVHVRDRVYELDGDDSRTLATVGAFRVVSETDLREPLEHGQAGRRSLHHLEDEGLIRTVPSAADARAVVLTNRGRDLLEAHRSIPRDDRVHEPRQEFYAGLRKPRELTHDSKVYRAYQRAEARLRDLGGRVRRVVLDYELKRDYQRFLHERNRGRPDCDGRPDRTPEEIERWAREHDLPYDDEGHVHFPDVRLEYEDADGRCRHEDLEVVTENYRGAHASAAARSGFTCYRAGGSLVGGRGGGGRAGGRAADPRLAEELL